MFEFIYDQRCINVGFKFYFSVPLDLFFSFLNNVVFVAQSNSQG